MVSLRIIGATLVFLVSIVNSEHTSRCDIDIFCPTVPTYYVEQWNSITGHLHAKETPSDLEIAFSKFMHLVSPLYCEKWDQWKHHNPHPQPPITDEAHAFHSFVHNMDLSSQFNEASHRADTSGNPARFGANAYAHLSNEEFKALKNLNEQAEAMKNHPKPHEKFLAPIQTALGIANDTLNNETVVRTDVSVRGGLTCGTASKCDWRTKTGIVGAVQNQGLCGSCWAFSASEAIRSCNAVTHGLTTLDQLSAEQLLDCSQAEGNIYGCSQGYLWDGYVYVLNNLGINTNSNYPYTAGATGMNSSCITSLTTNHAATMTQHYWFYQGSGAYMTTQVNVQPITANLAGGSSYFQTYVSGIMTNATACGTNVDHSVLVIGYGTSGSTSYWLIRNQWGTSWGMSGDAMILRDPTNSGLIGMCAVMSFSTYVTC